MKTRKLITNTSSFLLFTFIWITINTNKSYGQELPVWQGLPFENPAAIGTPSDFIFGNILFTKSLNNSINPQLGIDLKINPKVGSFGLFYGYSSSGFLMSSEYLLSYAYPIQLNKLGTLNIGFASGLDKLSIEPEEPLPTSYGNGYYASASSYYNYYGYGSSYYNTPSSVVASKFELRQLKFALGLYLDAENYEFGASYNFYKSIKDEIADRFGDLSLKPSFNAQACWRFNLNEKWQLAPNVRTNFTRGSTDVYWGAAFTRDKRFWLAYNALDGFEIHTFSVGCEIRGKFRLGYSLSRDLLFRSSSSNLHEIQLAYRIQ